MFKAILDEILYLLFDIELNNVRKLSKAEAIICGIITAIILLALLFGLIYLGLNALAFKKQTLGVATLLIAFVFTFIVLLKVIRIGR